MVRKGAGRVTAKDIARDGDVEGMISKLVKKQLSSFSLTPAVQLLQQPQVPELGRELGNGII